MKKTIILALVMQLSVVASCLADNKRSLLLNDNRPITGRMAETQIAIQQCDTDGFPLVDHTTCPIMISKADGKTVNKVAQLFAGDIERVTGRVPRVVTSTKPKCKYMVVIGTIQGNDYIKKLGEAGKIDVHAIDNAWERYVVKVVDNPSKGVEKALVIAGSDRRGAAYGTFAVSEAIGVSPWYWWAKRRKS